jgi:hypothetical protein
MSRNSAVGRDNVTKHLGGKGAITIEACDLGFDRVRQCGRVRLGDRSDGQLGDRTRLVAPALTVARQPFFGSMRDHSVDDQSRGNGRHQDSQRRSRLSAKRLLEG